MRLVWISLDRSRKEKSLKEKKKKSLFCLWRSAHLFVKWISFSLFFASLSLALSPSLSFISKFWHIPKRGNQLKLEKIIWSEKVKKSKNFFFEKKPSEKKLIEFEWNSERRDVAVKEEEEVWVNFTNYRKIDSNINLPVSVPLCKTSYPNCNCNVK